MTVKSPHPLAEDYLKRLSRAGRRLPRARWQDLRTEIEAHLAEAVHPDSTDAEVLTVLDRLGDPEDIVEAEMPSRAAAPDARGTREWAAIFLLLFGGFFFGFGWVFGLILLWSSPRWTTRDKWIGTLVVPGGLVGIVFFLGTFFIGASGGCSGVGPGLSMHCTSTGGGTEALGIAAVVALVAAPLITAVYLAKRAR